MNRILLVGKYEAITEALYKTLELHYKVQLCHSDENMKNVVAMTKIVKPDMVVLNTLENGDINNTIFDELTKVYSNMPILVIGSKEHCDVYQNFYKKNITPLHRPVSTNAIMECCVKMLGDKKHLSNITEDKEPEVRRKSILIVDDSALTLRSVKAILDKDYEVSVATSGERAITEMKKKHPDLVLLDYEMPGCDGRETFEIIKKDDEIKDVPVVFLTAVADKEHIAAVLQLGPAGYLLKPPDKEVLKETIDKVLEDR